MDLKNSGMAARIRALFIRDILALGLFCLFLWVILPAVAGQVAELTENPLIKWGAFGISAFCGVALTWAMLAVFLHLKKNRDEIYSEDLRYQDMIKAQKEGEVAECGTENAEIAY